MFFSYTYTLKNQQCGYFNKGAMQILEHKMQIINNEI